jgi:hypothetical protein
MEQVSTLVLGGSILASAVLKIDAAARMISRTRRDQRTAHGHDHRHDSDEAKLVDTDYVVVRLKMFDVGVLPRLRPAPESTRDHAWRVRSGDVIIAHMNRPKGQNAKGLAPGILQLLKRGFTFVRLDQVDLEPVP